MYTCTHVHTHTVHINKIISLIHPRQAIWVVLSIINAETKRIKYKHMVQNQNLLQGKCNTAQSTRVLNYCVETSKNKYFLSFCSLAILSSLTASHVCLLMPWLGVTPHMCMASPLVDTKMLKATHWSCGRWVSNIPSNLCSTTWIILQSPSQQRLMLDCSVPAIHLNPSDPVVPVSFCFITRVSIVRLVAGISCTGFY